MHTVLAVFFQFHIRCLHHVSMRLALVKEGDRDSVRVQLAVVARIRQERTWQRWSSVPCDVDLLRLLLRGAPTQFYGPSHLNDADMLILIRLV